MSLPNHKRIATTTLSGPGLPGQPEPDPAGDPRDTKSPGRAPFVQAIDPAPGRPSEPAPIAPPAPPVRPSPEKGAPTRGPNRPTKPVPPAPPRSIC